MTVDALERTPAPGDTRRRTSTLAISYQLSTQSGDETTDS
jgi:hypothetical protein